MQKESGSGFRPIVMPYKSRAQQRFLESKASPLSPAQKKEWARGTDFANLPEHVGDKPTKPASEPRLRLAERLHNS